MPIRLPSWADFRWLASRAPRFLCGLSTDVVGYLCEVLSGQALGMVDTDFQVPADQLHRFAAGYQSEGQGYVLQDAPMSCRFVQRVTYSSGVAGLMSTTADSLRFTKMLANGGELGGVRIIGPRTLQSMTINHLPGGSDLPPTIMGWVGQWLHGYGFGLGFAVLLDPTRSQTLGTPGEYHWEGAPAHSSSCRRSPG